VSAYRAASSRGLRCILCLAVWLPVQYSFSRNETVAAINAGKYSNIRGIFSPSATTPTAGKWKTAQQAIEDGNETAPSYSLFDMGALCWYFAQELVERGVKTPIGIADTAIGGQRIEEFMNNESYANAIACPDAVGAKEIRTPWNGQLFAKQVMPFVDMTVKGWTWCEFLQHCTARTLSSCVASAVLEPEPCCTGLSVIWCLRHRSRRK
jgi:hypothetical protein